MQEEISGKLKYYSIFICTRKFHYNMNFNNYVLHLKRLVEAVKHRDISFCYSYTNTFKDITRTLHFNLVVQPS